MKAYEFCKEHINKDTTPKYVKLQMKDFMRVYEGKDEKYIISKKKLKQLENILKLLVMPKGLKAGKSLYETTCGYQWLFYTAIFCTVYRDNPDKRRYETGVLEICRKNFKTYTVSTIFIILFLTEPNFSKFYSVAPDGSLSREIKEAIAETIRSSPLVYEYKNTKRFKLLRDYIMFKPTQTQYVPLSYSTSRMDGKLPNAFCADEVGALPISYPIQAMRSGQLNILNKLGFIISTKYPTIDNPFEDEVKYSKQVLDGIEDDESRFSLLYEPDQTRGWETNDLIMQQANPVALEIPEIWDDLVKKRAYAIAVDSARENFVTKHCNIIYQGVGTENYIDVKDVQECKVANIDWAGRVVYLGLDLSETSDNTSVSMVSVDDSDNILSESFAFIPEGRIQEKTSSEKVNYQELIKTKHVIACGDRVIDYKVVEDFILDLENKYGVQIQAIGYDRYNALSTAQKLENAGYNLVEIRQHSSVLHSPTKLLKEKILSKEFEYENNRLLEINFQNARCTYDTNRNLYVNKKKSNGKVDMVVSLINACYLLEKDYFLNQAGGFTIQVF
jgi:phage terminase large subunit-like protein